VAVEIDLQPREDEELLAGFLQAVRDGPAFDPPFADKGFAASGNLLAVFA
jgi:hypothetical protein